MIWIFLLIDFFGTFHARPARSSGASPIAPTLHLVPKPVSLSSSRSSVHPLGLAIKPISHSGFPPRATPGLRYRHGTVVSAVELTGVEAGIKPGLRYRHGTVVSASILASQVGVDQLKNGGTVVDAAIAVQFALAVVFPTAGNIGGGGFMVVRRQKLPRLNQPWPQADYITLDYREKAPQSAHKNMYLDSSGKVIEGSSTEGLLASGIPGVVDGMIRAHARFGKRPWSSLLSPAVALASQGFVLGPEMARALNRERATFIRLNGSSCSLVKPLGEWKSGDRLIQRELARVLRLIALNGRKGFYEGETGQKLLAQMGSVGTTPFSGSFTQADLSDYKAVWRKPLIFTYGDYQLITMPPPSSGGLGLIQLLTFIKPFEVDKLQPNSWPYIHLVTEAERRVYADRSYFMGDPDFIHIPLDTLRSTTYLQSKFKDYIPGRATPSGAIQPGPIAGYETIVPHPYHESEETTHFSIADGHGNAVSVTTTLNDSFGSKVVARGCGFLLNNEMDDFSIKPGVANTYGLVGGEANSIQAGKRMLSSMTPSILDKKGKLFMVVGSPGGATIITTVFQTIINVLDFNMTMQKAVSAPRFHSQWLPDVVYLEKNGFNPATVDSLTKGGHSVRFRGSIGRCDAILIHADGTLEPGADPRGEDQAAGY